MRRFLLALVILALLIAGTAVLAVNYQRPVRTISLEDDSRTLLVYHRLPERLVILDAAAGRLLQQLGLGAKVVGVSAEAAPDYPLVEQLGQSAELDPLAILALRPDLVVLGQESANLALVLRHGGVNVFLIAPASVEQLLSGIARLGKLWGIADQATAIAEQLRSRLDGLRESSPVTESTSALFFTSQQLCVAGEGTLEADLLKQAGASSAFPGDGYATLTATEAMELSPTVMLVPETLSSVFPFSQPIITTPAATGTEAEAAPAASRLVIIPGGFAPVTWENVYDRVAWLQQQLTSATR